MRAHVDIWWKTILDGPSPNTPPDVDETWNAALYAVGDVLLAEGGEDFEGAIERVRVKD